MGSVPAYFVLQTQPAILTVDQKDHSCKTSLIWGWGWGADTVVSREEVVQETTFQPTH